MSKRQEKMEKWAKVDWDLSPSDIAKDMKVSLRTVHLYKKKLGIKPSIAGRKSSVDWLAVDWSKSSKEISEDVGHSPSVVDGARQRHLLSKKKVNWDLVDWSLTDIEISEQLETAVNYVYTKRQEFQAHDFSLSDKGVAELASLMIKDAALKSIESSMDGSLKDMNPSDVDKVKLKIQNMVDELTKKAISTLPEWLDKN